MPKDFELIYEGKGLVHDTFAKESEFKKKYKDELKQKISEIGTIIKKVKEEKLNSVNELNCIIVSAAIKVLPAGCYICNSRGNQISYADLFSDDYVRKILKGELYYRGYYSGITCISSKMYLFCLEMSSIMNLERHLSNRILVSHYVNLPRNVMLVPKTRKSS